MFSSRDSKGSKGKAVNDLDDFLKTPAASQARPSSQGTSMPPKAPRIDVANAQRWPEASDINTVENSGRPRQSSMKSQMARIGRGKRSLTVTFVTAAPEVIGHGGDETDTPVMVISKGRPLPSNMRKSNDNEEDDFRPNKLTRAQTSYHEKSPVVQENLDPPRPSMSYRSTRSDPTHDGFQRAPLKRVQTGRLVDQSFMTDFGAEPDLRLGPQTGKGEPYVPKNEPQPNPQGTNVLTRPAEFRRGFDDDDDDEDDDDDVEGANPSSFKARLKNKMRAEEGRALHAAVQSHYDYSEDEGDRQDRRGPNLNATESRGARQPSPNNVSSINTALSDPRRSRSNQRSERDPSPNTAYPSSSSPQSIPASLSPAIRSAPKVLPINHDPSPVSSQQAPSNYPTSNQQASSNYPTSSQQASSNYPTQSLPPKPLNANPAYYTGSPSSNHESPLKSPLKSPLIRSPYDSGTNAMNRMPSAATNSLLRAEAASGGDAALDDFAGRVVHMKGIFRLTAELEGPPTNFTPLQWLRASIWWFLKGRSEVEVIFRNRPRSSDGPPDTQLKQHHVDIAKALWILTDVIAVLPNVAKYGSNLSQQLNVARNAGDQAAADVLDAALALLSAMKNLVLSMGRNRVMPPQQALLQGQDQTIWVKYPRFASDVQAILSGSASRSLVVESQKYNVNPITLIPLADNQTDFCFGRMFVQVSVTTEDDADGDRITIPCVLSILRTHNDWYPKIIICSQNDLVNVTVQSDRKLGVTWEDVRWRTKAPRSVHVRLPRGFTLNLELPENDFRTLWGIYDFTDKIEGNMREKADETLIHELTLKDFQYSVSAGTAGFPAEKVPRCGVRVFEKAIKLNERTGQRRLHRGYRLMVVTSPKNRSLGSVNHEFGTGKPMNYETRVDPKAEGSHVMVLRVNDKDKACTLSMGFNDSAERERLYSLLNSMVTDNSEIEVVKGPLKCMFISEVGAVDGFGSRDVLHGMRWTDFWITNKDPDDPSMEQAETVLSDSLRVIARHAAGSVTDRMNLGTESITRDKANLCHADLIAKARESSECVSTSAGVRR